METLVIGDLHGQVEIASKALDSGFPLVFIGDYLDSFNRSIADQLDTLECVLEAVRRGKAIALKGNHDISYLDSGMRCSGYKPMLQLQIDMIQAKMNRYLLDFAWVEGFFISHAGVSQRLLDDEKISLQDYLAGNNYKQIGVARGGRDSVGGLYWCDWNKEFEPILDTPQIVGHTRGRSIRNKGNSFCIDCLEDSDPKGLLIKDGKSTIYHF